VLACEIEWRVISNGIPEAVPQVGERDCIGEARWVRLVPLGSARLHVGELPTVELVGGKERRGSGRDDVDGELDAGGESEESELVVDEVRST